MSSFSSKSYPNDELDLLGFLDVGPRPTFLVPVFGNDRELFLQSTDSSGAVNAFSRLPSDSSENLTRLAELSKNELVAPSIKSSIGKQALHAFGPDNGRLWIGDRTNLSTKITDWTEISAVDPLLRLEIYEFCEAPNDRIRSAIRAAALR
jgi:hypothetical protein